MIVIFTTTGSADVTFLLTSGLFSSPLLRKSTAFITRAVGDTISMLFWVVTQGGAVNSVPMFQGNMSVLSSRFKMWILFGLLDP